MCDIDIDSDTHMFHMGPFFWELRGLRGNDTSSAIGFLTHWFQCLFTREGSTNSCEVAVYRTRAEKVEEKPGDLVIPKIKKCSEDRA